MMDGRTFDRIARAFGAAASRRAALAGLVGLALGTGAGPAAAEPGAGAERHRRRNRCRPECPPGQRCKRTACACINGGTVCGAECCISGQTCQDGRCVSEPAPCLPLGEACKDTGRICCDGLTCGSGQGGEDDIACYAPAGAACATTADCVYGAECVGGACQAVPNPCAGATVCSSGCPFTTIEAALAAARPGDVVTVAPGRYTPVPKLVNGDPVFLQVEDVTLTSCDPARRVDVVFTDPGRAFAAGSAARGTFSNPIGALFRNNILWVGASNFNFFADDSPVWTFMPLNVVVWAAPPRPGLGLSLSNLGFSGPISRCLQFSGNGTVQLGSGITLTSSLSGAQGLVASAAAEVLCVSRVRFGPYPIENRCVNDGGTISPSCGCED